MSPRHPRRRVLGLLPRLGHTLSASAGWLVRHPQPVLLLGGLALASWSLANYAQQAQAFRVSQVSLPLQSSLRVPPSLIGQSLWAVDLRAVAEELHRQQPSFKEVRVIRQLPNTLRIDAIPRLPVAQVRLDRWYPVDGEGFVLSQPSIEPDERLIRITGLDRAGASLSVGRENTAEPLRLALRVLQTLRRAPMLTSRRISELNVSNSQQIRFVIDGETEIRCGSEAELQAHLERLRAALKAMVRQPMSAQYIDVRFQEPVIAPRVRLHPPS